MLYLNLVWTLKYCPNCGASVYERKDTTIGSMLSVRIYCLNGHEIPWNSQRVINKTPAGNLLLAAAILFTGNTFARINEFCACLNLKFISKSLFYDVQDKYLYPVIGEAWDNETKSVVEQFQQERFLSLCGDGRCDSPGHNAKYGTYTMMEESSGKVVSFNIVQVTEVTSSNAMEKEGFERCIDHIQNQGLTIHRIATDRHISIGSVMNKKYTNIRHQFDIWHVSKSVVKKLTQKSLLKGNGDLKPWISSVSRHLWWSAATCGQDATVLKEKWVSLVNHVANKHSWSGANNFHQCAHGLLSRKDEKEITWLKPGSTAHVALEDVVTNKRLLKDLEKLTDFCHTGALEVYHSLMLKYSPKREHFSYKGMIARTKLAAMDNNSNTGRKQAVVLHGENAGQKKYKKCFPKAYKHWVVKPIPEQKVYKYRTEMLKAVLERCEQGKSEKTPAPITIPSNIANVIAPPKEGCINLDLISPLIEMYRYT